jgi:hypothetical protein
MPSWMSAGKACVVHRLFSVGEQNEGRTSRLASSSRLMLIVCNRCYCRRIGETAQISEREKKRREKSICPATASANSRDDQPGLAQCRAPKSPPPSQSALPAPPQKSLRVVSSPFFSPLPYLHTAWFFNRIRRLSGGVPLSFSGQPTIPTF